MTMVASELKSSVEALRRQQTKSLEKDALLGWVWVGRTFYLNPNFYFIKDILIFSFAYIYIGMQGESAYI